MKTLSQLNLHRCLGFAFSLLTCSLLYGDGDLPMDTPGQGQIVVSFMSGEKVIRCRTFRLEVRAGERLIVSGKFASPLTIPTAAKALSAADVLDIELSCGRQHWYFDKIDGQPFLPGEWIVGTDFPPFQPYFRSWPQLRDAKWVKYIIVKPVVELGFTIYRYCSERLKDVNP